MLNIFLGVLFGFACCCQPTQLLISQHVARVSTINSLVTALKPATASYRLHPHTTIPPGY